MITYKFVPGPFMRTLVAALEDASTTAPHKHYLIIEELNRAKAAAVLAICFNCSTGTIPEEVNTQ